MRDASEAGTAQRPYLHQLSRLGRYAPLALAALLGLAAAFTSIGLELDRGLQVARWASLRHAATGKLVFVDLDARSLAAYRGWPWPRSRFAAAINALNRAGAQTIAIDVDFSAPSLLDEDTALARAIATSHAPVVLPTFRQASSLDGRGTVENLPIPALREHAELAAVNIYADRDGIVRAYPYGIVTAGVPRPSIGAVLAGDAGRAGRSFPIDGSIDAASIPHVSFVDLLAGRADPRMFKGRGVLIGASAIELGDRYPLPGMGVVPGAMIQLIAAETLLQRSSPVDRGAGVPLMLALAAVAGARRGGARRRGIVLAGAGAAILLLPLATEWAKLGSFTIAPALLALAGGALALSIEAGLRAVREARHIDADTGLPNARSLRNLLTERSDGSVLVLRLVNFGDVTTILGRGQSADLIARVADRLAHAGNTAIHRLDEGTLAWVSTAADTEEDAERIDAATAMLRAPFDVAGRQVELTFAFGLASAGERDAAAQAAKAADYAIARSLRWARYTADMKKETEWRLSLATELDQAMAAGDIWVAYQPKLDIRAGRITATEALVRWRHPTRGMIPPDAFIPALEESGRIADLTLYVLQRALADRADWAAQGLVLDVAVNLSALLPSDAAFLHQLEAVLAEHPNALGHLTLEVTESAAMSDPEHAIEALDRLAGLGIALSIDDYGTGLSTLSYLKRLPAREIKIDKSFVLGLEASRSDQAMVRSTIDLAHELGFKVVAEGVETEAVLRMLAAYGCDTAQGWHIGRPMPAADLAAMVLPQQSPATIGGSGSDGIPSSADACPAVVRAVA